MQYCVEVVDDVMAERRKGVEGTEAGLDAQPNVRAKLYSDEVLVSTHAVAYLRIAR